MFIITPILSQGIYAGIINTISTATMGTCKLVGSLYSYNNPDIKIFLRELDIERRINIIRSTLYAIDKNTNYNETNNTEINKIDDDKTDNNSNNSLTIYGKKINISLNIIDYYVSNKESNKKEIIYDYKINPITLCLKYIREIIWEINRDLEEMKKKVDNHKSKWFNNWRSLNIKPLMKTIEINSNLLEKRFDDLNKIAGFLGNIPSK